MRVHFGDLRNKKPQARWCAYLGVLPKIVCALARSIGYSLRLSGWKTLRRWSPGRIGNFIVDNDTLGVVDDPWLLGIMDLGRYSHGRYSLIFGHSKIAERILDVSDRTIGPALASCCLTVCSMVWLRNDASPFPPNFLPTPSRLACTLSGVHFLDNKALRRGNSSQVNYACPTISIDGASQSD
jgi:hypothetical protein